MNKSELVEALANNNGLTYKKAEEIVNIVFDSMADTLSSGGRIEIRGFGSFTVRQYKAYEGRNPRSGEPVHVAPKRLPFFKVGKELRERVNGKHPGGPMRSETQAAPRAAGQSTQKPSPSPRGRDENLSEDVI